MKDIVQLGCGSRIWVVVDSSEFLRVWLVQTLLVELNRKWTEAVVWGAFLSGNRWETFQKNEMLAPLVR